jgi:hypothetical protein
MKPQTKKQLEIIELSKKLKPISTTQSQWAYNKCFDSFAVRSRNTMFCLDCGFSWKVQKDTKTTKSCTCTKCNKKLKMFGYSAPVYSTSSYCAILETKEKHQIVRMFLVSKAMKKLQTPCFSIQEVMQHFIDEQGNVISLSKKTQPMGLYYDSWIGYSDLEIRQKSERQTLREAIIPYKILPKGTVLPIIKRNGFNGMFFDFSPHKWFSILLSNPKAETLLKAKQYEVLNHFETKKINKYWNALKTVIRSNYTITDASMYFDYLNLVNYFQLDASSPKYACPVNLIKAHDKLMNKKNEIFERNQLKKRIETIESAEEDFEKQKSAFFGLAFQNKNITVKVIDSVQGFYEEANFHKHCLFSNSYYEKKNSLILSASMDNQPLETVEVSLKKFQIIQARGKNNLPTQYHNDIVEVVNQNMILIQNIFSQTA